SPAFDIETAIGHGFPEFTQSLVRDLRAASNAEIFQSRQSTQMKQTRIRDYRFTQREHVKFCQTAQMSKSRITNLRVIERKSVEVLQAAQMSHPCIRNSRAV